MQIESITESKWNKNIGQIELEFNLYVSAKFEKGLLINNVINYEIINYNVLFDIDGSINGSIISGSKLFKMSSPDIDKIESEFLNIPLDFADKYDMEQLFGMMKIPNDQYNQYVSVIDLFNKVKTINMTIQAQITIYWSYIIKSSSNNGISDNSNSDDNKNMELYFTPKKIKAIKNDNIYIGGYKLKTYKPIFRLLLPNIDDNKIRNIINSIHNYEQ